MSGFSVETLRNTVVNKLVDLWRQSPTPSITPDNFNPTDEEVKAWQTANIAEDEFLCRIGRGGSFALFGFMNTGWPTWSLRLPYNRLGHGGKDKLTDRVIAASRKTGLKLNEDNWENEIPQTWARLGIEPTYAYKGPPRPVEALNGAGGNHYIHFLTLEIAVRQEDEGLTAAIEFAKTIEAAFPGITVMPMAPASLP